jgi:DNA-directed RNA polymerase subunit E'/Rpb7
MILEGVVTNVANFGAFVDIGVHQDGSPSARPATTIALRPTILPASMTRTDQSSDRSASCD